MDTAPPRSPFVLATWLWTITTIAVLAAGPLLFAHPRGPRDAERQSAARAVDLAQRLQLDRRAFEPEAKELSHVAVPSTPDPGWRR
jgi:hypothetical protein